MMKRCVTAYCKSDSLITSEKEPWFNYSKHIQLFYYGFNTNIIVLYSVVVIGKFAFTVVLQQTHFHTCILSQDFCVLLQGTKQE